MVLPNELIQEFAKLTNDTDRKTPNNVMYGTIVDYNDSKWVRIDGSDLLTPISSITNVSDGDRVIVGIHNHKAIINGNLTYPSTTSPVVEQISGQVAGKIVAEEIDAEFANIDVLLAGYIKVDQLDAAIINSEIINSKFIDTEELKADRIEVDQLIANSIKAERAEIDVLLADKITTKELEAELAEIDTLIANKVTTEELEAERAEIDKLIANKANITDLNATNATVGNLSADVADINTLIFGSATGDTIHVNFANAVVQQIGDAQIKSAMIESISAGKITAGDIITNNVRVMSEDGSLLISDQTIQIKDDKRVRVQIGEDASGDYSIYIWDANGNLMFDPTGVQEKGITKAIIKNDMVNANANISASKLDINSLFTEINGSTNTIKSTKIYLDDEKQTLDVVFKSMDTTVTEMGKTISSQGTQISTIQGQISSKIWQQDITTATTPLGTSINTLNTQYSSLNQTVNGLSSTVSSHTSEIAKKADNSTVTTVSNKVSSLEQNLNGFKSTVSETYTTKTEFNNLEVGGRNLVHGTGNASGWTTYTEFNADNREFIKKTTSTSEALMSSSNCFDLEAGETYTLSFRAKQNGYVKNSEIYILPKTYNSTGIAYNQLFNVGTTYTKYIFTFSPSTKATNLENCVLRFDNNGSTTNGTEAILYVKDIKLEKGNKATDWTPAPEDTDTIFSSLETKITQNTNSITSQASSISSLDTRMSTVEQTANGLTVSLQTTNNNVSTAQTTANNAAKTATNFMSYDSTNGLLVGNKSSGSWSGNRAQITSNAFNVLNSSGTQLASFGSTATIGPTSSQNIYIDSDSVDIRKGNTVLASFDANTIQLGNNSSLTRINLCGGVGSIYAQKVGDVYQGIIVSAAKHAAITGSATELCTSIEDPQAPVLGRVATHEGYYVDGDHTGYYANSSIKSEGGASQSFASVAAIAYADYTDAHVNINAHDGTNTGMIEVYPSYINLKSPTNISKPVSITDTLTVSGTATFNGSGAFKGGFEIIHATPYIDFRFGKSTTDYTSRIIEESSGILTVTGGLKIGADLYFTTNNKKVYWKDANGTDREVMRLNNSTDTPTLILGDGLYSAGIGQVNIASGKRVMLLTSTDRVSLEISNNSAYSAFLYPTSNGTCVLGKAANRWHSVYAANGTIQTSDRREKENIIPLGTNPVATYGMRSVPEEQIDIHSELFDRLQPVQYNFINGDGRTNYGLIAQDVISAMEELGIDENELGLVYHEWHTDEETGEEKDTYGIAYANLIALLIHEVQKLKTEVNTLKGEQNNG